LDVQENFMASQTQPAQEQTPESAQAQANRPRRISRRIGRIAPNSDAYIRKTMTLYCTMAKRIWAAEGAEVQDAFLVLQNQVLHRCNDREKAELERTLVNISREVLNDIDHAIEAANAQKGTQAIDIQFDRPREIVCEIRSPAFGTYIELLQRLDVLLMLIDALWLSGHYDSADRSRIGAQWRSEFTQISNRLVRLIRRCWARIETREEEQRKAREARDEEMRRVRQERREKAANAQAEGQTPAPVEAEIAESEAEAPISAPDENILSSVLENEKEDTEREEAEEAKAEANQKTA
jgi:hypothetical protein